MPTNGVEQVDAEAIHVHRAMRPCGLRIHDVFGIDTPDAEKEACFMRLPPPFSHGGITIRRSHDRFEAAQIDVKPKA